MKKNGKMFARFGIISYFCIRLNYGNVVLFAKWGIVP